MQNNYKKMQKRPKIDAKQLQKDAKGLKIYVKGIKRGKITKSIQVKMTKKINNR